MEDTMRTLFGLVAAGALTLVATPDAHAQITLSLGNPYGYSGYGGYGLGGYGLGGYGLGYPGGVTSYYSSGYSGFAPAYGVRPYGYGYGGYGGYGYRRGWAGRGYGGGRFRRW